MIEEAEKYISKREMYDITGIQFMELNTIFQLLALKKERPHMLERTDKMLFMPDLFAYMLTGEKNTEYSIATTSQMIDLKTNSWSEKLLDKLGIKKDIFAPIVKSGTKVGFLSKEICEECGVPSVPVIAVCEHDTQSAISAVPCPEGEFAFISSGTWSLFGTELEEPVVNDTTYEINVTNEGGYDFSTGFLKNIIGLWLIQESRRQWAREGENYSYADLEKLALEAEPFKCFIDPDAPEFVPHGNLPERVREYCRKTNQYVPETVGEIMRCIYESIAMKYRYTFRAVREVTNKEYAAIHMIGGGTKDRLLCQMTADSCNIPVIAGPIEATAMGNVAVQLMALGAFSDLKEVRRAVAASEDPKHYAPENAAAYDEAYERFVQIL
jgi:rhamnulokinase/L-fuculokinase